MNISLNNLTLDKYFGFLYKLDNLTKSRLIAKLTKSIATKEEENVSLKSLCGSWEDSRTSDEIISDIKGSRIEKKNSIDF